MSGWTNTPPQARVLKKDGMLLWSLRDNNLNRLILFNICVVMCRGGAEFQWGQIREKKVNKIYDVLYGYHYMGYAVWVPRFWAVSPGANDPNSWTNTRRRKQNPNSSPSISLSWRHRPRSLEPVNHLLDFVYISSPSYPLLVVQHFFLLGFIPLLHLFFSFRRKFLLIHNFRVHPCILLQ